MEIVGGVFAMWERSFDGQPSPAHSICSDLMFWNSFISLEHENKKGSNINYNVVTGFLRDYGSNILKAKASQVRQKLKSNGALKIIAVFDQAHTDQYEKIRQNENYTYILKFVIENPAVGVVFKPKKSYDLKATLSEEACALLDIAEKTGRCHVFYSAGKYQSNVPAILAALCSDICIHGSLYAGTAALECAFIGKPTLLLDREGHPFNILNDSNISESIFKNWSDLIYSLKENINTSTKNNNFGNLEKFIGKVEPFRDGRGAYRMGNYLNTLIQQFDQGVDRNTAMDNAAEIYMKKWGENTVVVS